MINWEVISVAKGADGENRDREGVNTRGDSAGCGGGQGNFLSRYHKCYIVLRCIFYRSEIVRCL